MLLYAIGYNPTCTRHEKKTNKSMNWHHRRRLHLFSSFRAYTQCNRIAIKIKNKNNNLTCIKIGGVILRLMGVRIIDVHDHSIVFHVDASSGHVQANHHQYLRRRRRRENKFIK